MFGGTSGAAAKVAAAVALMLQVNPKLTPEQVREIIKKTGGVVDISADPKKTAGVFLDAGTAVRVADSDGCERN
jgi:subtilisin family serine protease